MEKTIRLALIGFGTMGQLYARMLGSGSIPGIVLSGVCCRNALGRETLLREYPQVKIYSSIEQMEVCSGEFDACLIVTPHTSHVSIGLKMAAVGKHILMDKPAGVCAGEVKELVDFCKEKGVSYGVIFNNRRLPAFREAKKLLSMGILGTLHRAVWVCNSWYRSPAYHRSGSWRSSWNGECGGLMINQNPHYMDMWQWFFGLPQRLYADMSFGRYNDFLVDDAVDIQLQHDNGFHGTFVSATGEAPGVNRLEIWGSKGRMVIEDGKTVSLYHNEVDTETFSRINREPFGTIANHMEAVELPEPGNPYGDVFANFAAHLLDGEPLYADGAEGLKTAMLTNAVYVSGWEEKKVTLPVDEERFRQGLQQRQQMEQELNRR